MASFSFVIIVAAILGTAQGTKHGIIGFGINMYHPWCCTACYDVLSPLYLNCTTFEEMSHDHHGMVKRMDMGGSMGMTSPECYASDQPWLSTFSYCIKSRCDAENVDMQQQEQCWQKNAAGGVEVPQLTEALPAAAPTEELQDDAEWLNKTMLANAAKWQTDRNTISEFESVERDHSMFS
jgi:hypothetical protein